MLNREIFAKDPLDHYLVNNGVAEVTEERSQTEIDKLRYELETFVCEGQYAKGLDRILSSFLNNLGHSTDQPGVWISGFYGSGKTHLAKVLRALWINFEFPDGVKARDIVDLPEQIQDQLKELSIQQKRYGIHAAAGRLGSGAGANVRMALLGIVFKSVGLPEAYHRAQFLLWLKKKGLLEALQQELQRQGEDLSKLLRHMYVSDELHEALLTIIPDLAPNKAEVGAALQAQFPQEQDVSNDQMVEAMHDALQNSQGKFPLTLIALDEIQAFIGNNSDRAYMVQEVTETCCKHFEGKLLFIGTGQTAVTGTPDLQKIKGRFTVPIQLSDADVESVIRKIILRKKQSAVPELEKVMSAGLGEISRHLRGTKLEHTQEDEQVLVADYPLLPTRRRFWERVLRKLDESGTVSQLRNQLLIVHEATQDTAHDSLGHVVAADFIYDQLAGDLLQSGLLSREVYDVIGKKDAGDGHSQLKARLLKLIYMINKMPADAMAGTGLRPTADVFADLLVTELTQGSSNLRSVLPQALDSLQNDDELIMALETDGGTEYRLQTQESSAWHREYRQQVHEFTHNTQRVDMLRQERFANKCQELLKQVRLVQGQSKESRTVKAVFDEVLPEEARSNITVWFRDGWSSSEKDVRADAQQSGTDSPVIFVFIPGQYKTELRSALIEAKAAQLTLEHKGIPAGPDGEDARTAMQTRKNDFERKVDELLSDIFKETLILQGGGTEVAGSALTEQLHQAAQTAMIRLYPEFDQADHPGWGKVVERSRRGDNRALEAVEYTGEVNENPVCKAVLKFIGNSKKGSEVRDHFKGSPYGWPQDAIDGALLCLTTAGYLKAVNQQGQQVQSSDLERKQLTRTEFRCEAVTITPPQRIQIRKVFLAAGIQVQAGQELDRCPDLISTIRDLAQQAGGEAPKPEVPDRSLLSDIESSTGNSRLLKIFEHREALQEQIEAWRTTAEAIAHRLPTWELGQDLLPYAQGLPENEQLKQEAQAIIDQRALLAEHNPVKTLLDQVSTLLRDKLRQVAQECQEAIDQGRLELEQDDNWHQLSKEQQEDILAQMGIDDMHIPSASNPQELLHELQASSLRHWEERRQAIPGKFDRAREEAARLLIPKASKAHLPKRTLHTEDDLRSWLSEVEKHLKDQLHNGPVMI
jgi:hypothetical protein